MKLITKTSLWEDIGNNPLALYFLIGCVLALIYITCKYLKKDITDYTIIFKCMALVSLYPIVILIEIFLWAHEQKTILKKGIKYIKERDKK